MNDHKRSCHGVFSYSSQEEYFLPCDDKKGLHPSHTIVNVKSKPQPKFTCLVFLCLYVDRSTRLGHSAAGHVAFTVLSCPPYTHRKIIPIFRL